MRILTYNHDPQHLQCLLTKNHMRWRYLPYASSHLKTALPTIRINYIVCHVHRVSKPAILI